MALFVACVSTCVCVRTCAKVMFLCVLCVIALLQLLQYHCYRAKNYHQYVIYYIALLICVLRLVMSCLAQNQLYWLLIT